MTTQMIIRIDEDIKTHVDRLAKSEGKTTSRIVRELLDQYIQERDVGAYIDQLWNRVGKKMQSAGTTVKDVDRIIKEVRREHAKSSH